MAEAVGALPPFRACPPGTGTLPQETRPFSWKDAEQSRPEPGFGSGRASLSLPLATGQLSQATENWDSSIREDSSLCPIYTQHNPNLGREPTSFPWYILGLLSLHHVSQCKASYRHVNRVHQCLPYRADLLTSGYLSSPSGLVYLFSTSLSSEGLEDKQHGSCHVLCRQNECGIKREPSRLSALAFPSLS